METVLAFLRIGEPKYIMDLYENGTVYMNTLNFFRTIKDASLRGDPKEGAINLTDVRSEAIIKVSVNIRGTELDIHPTHIRYGNFLSGNLYCLYSISSNWHPDPRDFKFDPRNLEFGPLCLMIKQPGVFIERVETELKKSGYKFEHGFVKYYDEQTQPRNMTPFHKPKVFEYQREFRLYVDNENDEPLKINIGTMESYCEVFEAKDLLGLKLD